MSGEVGTGNHAASGAGGRKRACRAGRLPGVPGASEPCREDDTLSGAAPIGGAGGSAKDNEDRTVERRDVIVVGAGAAGLYCAGQLGLRGLRVTVLDHARRIGEKIRISGGGRCNFTNLNGADPARYLSGDPRFVRHALKAHPPERFIARVREARIGFHEKHLGQLFCDDSSQRIVDMLLADCARDGVQIRHPVTVQEIARLDGGDSGPRFRVSTSDGVFLARHLVVATGGLSIPAIGASDRAWQLARQWGMATVAPRPGLVPLTVTSAAWQDFAALSGVALPVAVSVVPATAGDSEAGTARTDARLGEGGTGQQADPGSQVPATPPARAGKGTQQKGQGKRKAPRPVVFHEDLLFTHRGLSGPGILQISSYWQPGQPVWLNLLPDMPDPGQWLVDLKAGRASAQALPGGASLSGQPHRQQLGTVLGAVLPARLVRSWLASATRLSGALMPPGVSGALEGLAESSRLAEIGDARLRQLGQALSHWPVQPAGSEGYRKAEVTVGGVATETLDPRSMQAHAVPGSYWIGEAVDVTGWLGGYNFQWAWASAFAAAQAIAAEGRV